MKDISSDSSRRYFGMVRVGCVNNVCPCLAYVKSKRITLICSRMLVRLLRVLNTTRKERIRASRVIRRVRYGQNVLVFPDGKPLNLAKLRLLELLLQLAQEVLSPSLVIRERHPQAFDRTIVLVRLEHLLGRLGHRGRTPASQCSRRIRLRTIRSIRARLIRPSRSRVRREFPHGRQGTSSAERHWSESACSHRDRRSWILPGHLRGASAQAPTLFLQPHGFVDFFFHILAKRSPPRFDFLGAPGR